MKTPYTVAVISPKGGVGKSTTSRSMAVQGLLQGFSTAILDADIDQETVSVWGEKRFETIREHAPLCRSLKQLDDKKRTRTVEQHIDELHLSGAQVVFVDTSPRNIASLNIIVGLADAVVVVTTPYHDDRQEVPKAVQIIGAIGKPAAVLLNRVDDRKAVVNREARDELGKLAVPLCPVEISDLTAYAYATKHGLAGQELDPTGTPGRQMAEVWGWFDANVFDPPVQQRRQA